MGTWLNYVNNLCAFWVSVPQSRASSPSSYLLKLNLICIFRFVFTWSKAVLALPRFYSIADERS